MEINNVSEAIDENDTTTQSSTHPPLPPPSSAATINILNELADREQRRKNLVFTTLKNHQRVKQINSIFKNYVQ